MATITPPSESASSADSSPNKPERKTIETGMASGSCSGFAMPMTILR